MQNDNNIFTQDWNTPHHTIPFDKITAKVLEDAIKEGMRKEDEEINAIAENPDAPTFENTIAALDCCGEMLSCATTVMYNLSSAETNDDLDALVQAMAPVLSEHNANISLNEKLFQRVKAVYAQRDQYEGEDLMLLDKTYQGFERSGATLNDTDKQRFREILQELSAMTVTFSQHLLKDTNAFQLHITHSDDLSGLPQSQIDQAQTAAKEKGLDGWLFTLKAPSYVPFMTYADNRELRKQMYNAYLTRCTHENEQNNFDVVMRIVNLRREMAQMLGYNTFADYALCHRMAETSQNVYDLLHKLIANYKPAALKEVAEVENTAKNLDGDNLQLMPWDWAYYSHKLQMERYNIDAEMLRPYFELSKVISGVFGLATKLYGITFKENKDIPTYHPDVKAFEVFDKDGSFLAVLYCDFHPRQGKQGGAWMTNYKEQWRDSNGDSRPHISLVMNLTKPTADKPALLTLGEVETFLHEFGHSLHGMFAATKYRSLSGTNVYWDFVELPSQFMENYAVEKDFLSTFAFHYQTGEPIPDDLIQRVRSSRNFNTAYACMRQVSFGLLDMAYYTLSVPFDKDVRAFESEAWKEALVLPSVKDACMTVQFGHIMSGGYAAGYYSYKWAEVLDADAFSLFKQNGIFNRQTAQNFRENVLSRGGTEHPMALYQRFRGQKPTIEALMKRDGIIKENDYSTRAKDESVCTESSSASNEEKAHLLDLRYLRMARIWAENSYCTRRQVGALIVKDKMIISDGYNGTPSGFENVCEDTHGLTKPYVLHAEANAITKIARSGNNSDGATLYVTDAPCIECAKLIIQAGIRRVIYAKQYRLTDGIELLRRAGIDVEYIPLDKTNAEK